MTFSTARQAGTWSQPRLASTGSTLSSTGSTGKTSTTGSTAPRRSLDSSTARQPGGFFCVRFVFSPRSSVTMKGGWAGAKVAPASEEPGDARRTPVTPPYSRYTHGHVQARHARMNGGQGLSKVDAEMLTAGASSSLTSKRYGNTSAMERTAPQTMAGSAHPERARRASSKTSTSPTSRTTTGPWSVSSQRRSRTRARQHRLRRVEHERQVVLRTPHAAARSGCAGGRREGYPEEDHRDEDVPYQGRIKDALKATGRG